MSENPDEDDNTMKRKSAWTVVKPQSVQSRLDYPALSQMNLNVINFRQSLSKRQGAFLARMPHVFIVVEKEFVKSEITNLLQSGCIKEVLTKWQSLHCVSFECSCQ